ncbi:carboxypeptidase-like regulatory domain-containing protein [Limibacter armeniacum]|uniref:carboxypeptidase-like regulatory domain-containing protein n=1 Tax=Limibacter armeniacum TaxID=466084 RepID=UPI002FE61958
MRKTVMLLFIFFGTGQFFLFAQTKLPEAKVDGLYLGKLDEVLDRLNKEYQLNLVYDKEKLHQYEFSYRYFNTEFTKVMDGICETYKLKYYFGEDGKIHLVGKFDKVETDKLRSEVKRSYAGDPTQFDLTVSGRVTEKSTGESLPYVTVVVSGTTIGTTSNVDGYFTLLQVPSDTSSIIVSSVGYRPETITLSPAISKKTLNFELVSQANELNEVIVQGEREDIMVLNQKVSAIKMTPSMLSSIPNLGEKDIFRSFQLMPGIGGTQEASSGLYVRGGTPDQNLVLYDGFTVYHVDHLFGFYSAFNANAIKDIYLYKGGFEPKYGGRLSSVAELVGKEGNQRAFNAGVDISLLSLNAFVEAPLSQKVSFFVAGRKSYDGPIYSKIFDQFNDDSDDDNTLDGGPGPGGPGGGPFGGRGRSNADTEVASYFYDLNAKLTYKPTEKDNLSLSFFNGVDNLDNSSSMSAPSFGNSSLDFSNTTNDLTRWGNLSGSAKWSRQWSPKFFTNTLVSYSNYFSKRDRSSERSIQRPDEDAATSANNGILENNDVYDLTAKLDAEWQLSDRQVIEMGVQHSQYQVDYTYSRNDTVTILDKSDKGSVTAAYIQDRLLLLNDKLTLTGGARVNYYDVSGKLYFEPRALAEYQLSDKWKLKGATGVYHQFVNRIVRQDIEQGSKDFWGLSNNENLPVSKAVHYIGGISYELDDYLFDVELYHKPLTGISEYSTSFQPTLGPPGSSNTGEATLQEQFYEGDGVADGIELLAQKKNGDLTGWVSYTLGQVAYDFPDLSENVFPADHDVTHEFKTVLNYSFRKWTFSTTWVYGTGRPYTAPESGYTLTLLDGTTEDYITVGEKNSRRLPDYHRMDISANYNFKWGNWPCTLGASIFNVYNHINVWYKEFTVVDNELIETDVNLLGITPNLTFSIRLQ